MCYSQGLCPNLTKNVTSMLKIWSVQVEVLLPSVMIESKEANEGCIYTSFSFPCMGCLDFNLANFLKQSLDKEKLLLSFHATSRSPLVLVLVHFQRLVILILIQWSSSEVQICTLHIIVAAF